MKEVQSHLKFWNVAMVTDYDEKITISCSPMLRHLFDLLIGVSANKEW